MHHNKQILIWLVISAMMVLIMVFVGGWTRLSNAGLSIVEWKPVTGVIPPMNELEWNVEFDKYKTSPEFEKIHNHFELDDFKKIFWLEFVHRILGRITGIVILLPALFFMYKRSVWKPYITMILLVGLQGFIGWWMVKSGLVDDPHVSHFRLAAHMLIAMILYSVIFWEWMVVRTGIPIKFMGYNCSSIIMNLYVILLFSQIFLGALVAGLDAGMIYNTFPLMGRSFIPSEFDFSLGILYDPASVQFLHRSCGYLLGLVTLVIASKVPVKVAIMLILCVVVQIGLGIFTVLYVVPMVLALMHQFFAVLLLSLVLYVTFIIRSKNYA